MKLKPHQRVTYEQAKERALAFLDRRVPHNPSTIGMHIWPDNNMRAQGLGASAIRILKRMEAEGLVRWTIVNIGERTECWGWVKKRL